MKHDYILKAALLAILAVVSLQLEAKDTLIDGLYYSLDADKHTAVLDSAADKTITSLEIPSTVESAGISYSVTTISSYFNKCTALQSLSIPATVTTMSTSLANCTALKELTLQDGSEALNMVRLNSNIKLEKLYLGRNLIYALMHWQYSSRYGYSGYSYGTETSPFYGSKTSLSSVTIGPQVTELRRWLFYGCSNLTVIRLPHVKVIQGRCFGECQRLTTLDLGDALESVNDSAFYQCTNLTNLAFPTTIKNIEYWAFYGCISITSVSFPSDCALERIGDRAFYDCSALTAFKCPETVSYIGESAFQDCIKLVTAILGKQLKKISKSTFEGDVALSDMTVPEGVTHIYDRAFYNCTGMATYSLPSTLDSIDNYVFYNNSGLVRLSIPGSVSIIGYCCFDGCSSLSTLRFEDGMGKLTVEVYYSFSYRYYCEFLDCPLRTLYLGRDLYGTNFWKRTQLKRVTFGKGVTYLNDNLFYGCTAITKLDFPDSLRTVMTHVFEKCTGLTELSFPGGVRSIGRYSFDDCSNLAAVTFEDGDTICDENGFFYDCPLQKVYIGRNLKYSEQDTKYSPFHNNKTLTDVTFSQNGTVTFIYDHLLRGCSSVEELALPQSLETIGNYSFSQMSRLKGITIYGNVISIGTYCFAHDTDLATAWLYDGAKTVGEYCFAYDTSLATARLSETLTKLSSHIFYRCSTLDNFTIPSSVEMVDTAAFKLCTSLSAIAINAKQVNDSAFSDCSSLKTLSFTDNVTSIGNNVFNACTSLRDITFADGVNDVTVGYNSDRKVGMFRESPVKTLFLGRNLIYSDGLMYSPFAYITVLDTLTLGTKLTNIGKYAFTGCSSLPRVFMPDNIKSVGLQAFMDCSALYDLTFSNNLVSVGEQSFENCVSLEKVSLPASLDALSSETFAGCTSLYDVNLGSTLNTIGPSAFSGCTRLEAVDIPRSVYGFGVSSFKDCTALRFMKLTEGIKSIGKTAFSGCTALEGVEFSENLVSIGDGAFTGCTALMTIRSWAEIPPEGLATFPDTVKNNAVVYVPDGTVEDYKDSPTWEDFLNFGVISGDIKVNAVTISEVEATLKRGMTLTLKAQVTPAFASNTTVTWSSDNETVATVTDEGVVAALSSGKANITATANDGSGATATCTVTVPAPLLGDSNGDDKVDVADVVNINNYLLLDAPATFDEEASDANKDGHISVSDISATVDIILSQTGQSSVTASAAKGAFGWEATPQSAIVYSQAAPNSISVALDDAGKYNAMQADIVLPKNAGDAVVKINSVLGSTHTLASYRKGDVLRVVLYSMSNKAFADGQPLFTVTFPQTVGCDDVRIVNAVASDNAAVSYGLSATVGSIATSVDAVTLQKGVYSVGGGVIVSGYRGTDITITTIGGALYKKMTAVSDSERIALPAGIYLVTVNGKTQKIVIK